MSQKIKIGLLIFGCIVILIIGVVLFNNWKNDQLVSETTKRVSSETRLALLVVQYKTLEIERDTLKTHKIKLEAVIEFQKNNPQIIIQQNDKVHMDINKLDALNSIKLFADNISKYDNNRERYSLHRFIRQDQK